MKKIVLVLLMFVLITPVMANPFSDVPKSHWAYNAVEKLVNKGILTGFSDGVFKGDKVLTRYELAMIMARFYANADTKNIASSDMAVVEKLTAEFADELILLGIRVNALGNQISMIKNDVSVINNDLLNGKVTDNGKIRFRGELEMRMESNTYKKSSTSGIYSPGQIAAAGIAPASADNFNGIIGNRTTANQTNENAVNFRTKIRLFMDAKIDEKVMFHGELRNRLANANYDIWGSAAHSADDEWATDVYEAYVLIQDLFGWADIVQIGRRYIGLKRNLALRINDKHEGDYGSDGITIIKKLSDVTKLTLSGSRVGTDEEAGLNFLTSIVEFNLKCGTTIKAAYASRNDSFIFDPANAGHYGDVGGWGANLAATYAANANYALNHDNPTKVHYYGIEIEGNIIKDLKYYGQIIVMDHKDTVLDANDTANWTDTVDEQNAFLLGLEWQANKKLNVKFEYRHFDEYYRPIVSTPRLYGAVWGYNYDGMGDYEYDNLGYTSDFKDTFIAVDYQLSTKTNVIATYELINDTKNITGLNRKDDDMDVWTLGFGYKYRKNVSMALYWKQFNVEDISAGATGSQLPTYFVDANANGVYDMGVDYLNLHDPAQEDHQQLRCELKVTF